MTLTQQVYEWIRRDIYLLKWSEYEFLTESALAKTYQVSKAPIREALYRLCREGMMESYPRKGYRIRIISAHEYRKIQKIRYANESLAVDFFLANPGSKLCEEIKRAAEHYGDVGSNLAFHMALARASQNQMLMDIIDCLLHCVARSITIQNQMKKAPPLVYHREIAAALEKGDGIAAKEYLKKDIGVTEEKEKEI